MTTARDICESILRKIHVLGQGQSISNDDLNDVLQNVNDMLAVWSVEGNKVFVEGQETFNLVSGQATYTIGTGQDFDTSRPLFVRSAYISQGGIDYPLRSYDEREYADIQQKSAGGVSRIYYFNGSYPTPSMSLYPVPGGTYTITLGLEKEITSLTDLNTTYTMPPEYKAAIIYNGAVWCAPEYEREPMLSVVRMANRTKKAISVQNARNDKPVATLGVPCSENQRNDYNIYGGN